MFRKKAAAGLKPSSDSVKWRGHEVTRIEAFSDAVFAFGITLLIVALEVPESYAQLIKTLMAFLPFAVCCIILFMIWFAQNMFFRRYGMHDTYTVVLNGILLFLVLFFVYPLKFLFSMVFSTHSELIDTAQAANLYYIYSGGFAAIYFIFVLMYRNALKHAEELKLSPVEIFDTKSHMYSYAIIAVIGLISMLCAFLGGIFLSFAGFVYILIGFGIGYMYSSRGKKKKLLFESTALEENIEVADDIPETELTQSNP